MRCLHADHRRPNPGYRIEDGVYTDEPDPDDLRSLTDPPSPFERSAEEARWASLCGPVTVRRAA